jgi:GH3 auxin-responsive promoter
MTLPPAKVPRGSWWRGLLAGGAGFAGERLRARLAAPGAAQAGQRAAWASLGRGWADTAFGREHGLRPGMSRAAWRALPPRRYEEFLPWIERMKAGEPAVLWRGRCRHFAVSSGTTAGRTKYLPVTAEMLGHFRRTGLASLLLHTGRVGHAEVFRGRHLFLGGSTVLTPLPAAGREPLLSGDLSGITALNLPGWVERHLYEPGREIALLADWPAKLEAIVARTRTRDLTLIAGIPSWLLILAERVLATTGRSVLREVWPRLECIVHGGVPLGPFARQLAAVAGPGVHFHEVYPASEGFIAAQDAEPAQGLRLLANAGIYYEFLPFADYDESRLGALADRVVPLAEVTPGVDYVLVMSTPAGLCRYVIGDVVRFVTVDPPRLVYRGRTRLQLSAFGEHVIEHEVTETLAEVAGVMGLAVANFHVAPRFVGETSAGRRGRHEWLLELNLPRPGLQLDQLATQLDAGLQRRNEDYEAKRRGGGLEGPEIRLLPEGTFAGWLQRRGKWGGQNKMPRCRSDREIAEALVEGR